MTLLSLFSIVLSESEKIEINHNLLVENIINHIENVIDKKLHYFHLYAETPRGNSLIKKSNDTYLSWYNKNNEEKPSIVFESILGHKNHLDIHCNWNTNFYSKISDGYLFWLCLYHSMDILLKKSSLIKIKSEWGPGEDIHLEIKEEHDISTIFNIMMNPDSYKELYKNNSKEKKKAYLIPYSLTYKIEKGSDVIPLLKVSYEEAKKMNIFPEEWEITDTKDSAKSSE